MSAGDASDAGDELELDDILNSPVSSNVMMEFLTHWAKYLGINCDSERPVLQS